MDDLMGQMTAVCHIRRKITVAQTAIKAKRFYPANDEKTKEGPLCTE